MAAANDLEKFLVYSVENKVFEQQVLATYCRTCCEDAAVWVVPPSPSLQDVMTTTGKHKCKQEGR